MTTPESISEQLAEEQAARARVRTEVRDFAAALEAKLLEKMHRVGDPERTGLPPEALLKLLKGETFELQVALEYQSPERGMAEAVDVANYALLIYKRCLEAHRGQEAARIRQGRKV